MMTLTVIGASGEEPHLGVCERTDREPLLWLSDQGEHDTADEELRVQVPSVRQVCQSCKETPLFLVSHGKWKDFSFCHSLGITLSFSGNKLWDRWEYTQLGKVQGADAAE